MNNILTRINLYNKNRDKEFIQLKYKALCENPFRFYRGTSHIFYEDFPKQSSLLKAPKTWLCGDLHLENFGSYKSANRLIYFDINDFDEAYYGPCTLDITRLLVSIIVSGKNLKIKEEKLNYYCKEFLNEYFGQLQLGHASRIEYQISSGIIKQYFDKIKDRNREVFIKNRVNAKQGKLELKIDNVRYFKVSKEIYKNIKTALDEWINKNKLNKKLFKIHDIAFRVAGTGSLGLKRYAVLVEGKGYPQNYILDLKEASNSSIQKHFPNANIKFKKNSARIIEAQLRMQDSSSAYLSAINLNKIDFILKEHQPTEDKIDLLALSKNELKFEEYIISTAKMLAWAQIRSSGYMKSATIDDLISFSKKTTIKKDCINYAFKYSKKVLKDYEDYLKITTNVSQT